MANPLDWFAFKMDLGLALGFNTVGKDMLEWGFNQGFDSKDPVWMYNAQGLMSDIWSQIVVQAAQRNLPCSSCALPRIRRQPRRQLLPGQPCDKSAGNFTTASATSAAPKLFQGIYAGNGEAARTPTPTSGGPRTSPPT